MQKKLPLWTKIIYGSGDFGYSMTNSIIAAYFLLFLTDVVGMSAATAGIAILIGRTWDYINDPLIGNISDRTKTRWGRRRPFLLFGAVPFAITFAMLWYKPAFVDQTALAVYYALAYILYDAAQTFVFMPYFALTPELTDDYDERTSLTSYRMVYNILGGLIAFTIPLMVVGSFSPQNASNVQRMGIIFGALSAIPLFLIFFKTRETQHPAKYEKPNIINSIKVALKNRPFVLGAVVYLATWTSMNIVQTVLLYYVKYVLLRESMSDILMGAIFITAIAALPLWNWVSKKLDKRKAYALGISFWALAQVLLMTLTSSTPVGWVVALCILAGIGVSAAHVLPWAMIPDAIEYGELNTGERHEGVFYSLVTLMAKVASSIAIPITAFVLELTGYVPNSSTQPQSALNGIRFLIGPVPAVCLIIGIVFALRYPLERNEFNEIVGKLKKQRGEEEAESGLED